MASIRIVKDIKKKSSNFITIDGKIYNNAEEYFNPKSNLGGNEKDKGSEQAKK